MTAALPEGGKSRQYRTYDEESRRQWQNPEAILEEIGLKPGDIFIDVGCGDGFFALPAARLAGTTGTVYGLDASPEKIARLEAKATRAGLTNLRLKVGRAEDMVLVEAGADFVFFGIVLHDFDDPAKVLTNAARMLKPKGRLVNLDWKKEPMSLGPPLHIRFESEKAKQLIEAGGFRVETVQEAGPYHYLILAHLTHEG